MKPARYALCILLASQMYAQVGGSKRTVIDNEIGSIFASPNGFTWPQVGAYVGSPDTVNFSYMSPAAVKVVHVIFHLTKPNDDTTYPYFPYTALRQYEANEVRAGRAPFFVTATYAGKKRPVLWSWSLKLSNGVPTAPQSAWNYAVNVGDDRFVKFWINRYVRPIVFKKVTNLQNLWVGLDQCAFNPDLYGVLDDNGRFVPGVPWDSPFPQGESAYIQSINTFFLRVKQLAPDLNLMPNTGSMKTWSNFATAYQNAAGVMAEEIYSATATSAFLRNKTYQQLTWIAWSGAQGKVTILRSYVNPSSASSVRNSYITYLLLKGDNSFYAPQIAGTTTAVAPSVFATMRTTLGRPVAAMVTTQQSGMATGYTLYSRQCEGGIVYLNWTGQTKTITLPTGRQYFDANGNSITQLTVADGTVNYALYTKGARQETPRINVRLPIGATSPRTVSVENPLGGGTMRYTIDGSTPTTASAVYSPTAPIVLYSNAVVKAVVTGTSISSFVANASYTVTAGLPSVQFPFTLTSGLAGTYYAIVGLNKISSVDVTVSYRVQSPTGSTVASGSVIIKAGSQYKYFAVPTSGSSGASNTVTLTSATNGALGLNTQLRYTIL